MARRRRRGPPPPGFRLIRRALRAATLAGKPVAFIVAGHNGSGKSTLWYSYLAPRLQIPLVNADRLTTSILPPPNPKTQRLPAWAQKLRDTDEQWQRLSQTGVQTFTALITAQKMPFAFETVFSHWKRQPDASYQSKAEVILQLKRAGYFVVLLFVGLANVELSILRVQTRLEQGGHAVPENKLRERYPRTLLAIRHAAALAHTTLMYDNSRTRDKAFSLARAQRGSKVLYDCREDSPATELSRIAQLWLRHVAPQRPS